MTLATEDDPGLRRIDARSVADQVTDEIRRSILSGALAPGESLSLRKLADRLGVSIIPVRDAIKNLHNEGLIVNPPSRSATVAPLDSEEFAAIYRLRRLLEPELARRAVTGLSDAELDRLHDVAADLGRPERSMDDIYDDHRAFHLALLAPAASSWDARILMQLWRAGERYIRIAFGLLDPDPHEHDRRREAHQLLVKKFRTRDPETAATALDIHLEHNETLAIRALDGRW
ncbi:GntR family transcriptional regulator [Flexivirga oryzae]|uniref:DNA-binding GntR family transcriptional regulator n=1 Tax=Flexivirga oryzae TaxID=1794944 RepID=A0A839NE62_9MICO|nr:GntR family transcriptional regulator [Flexivirga oryzae]MBB2893455.1 DNA-binding GntR family transcriptional regulator [Flexivirga oryzae]